MRAQFPQRFGDAGPPAAADIRAAFDRWPLAAASMTSENGRAAPSAPHSSTSPAWRRHHTLVVQQKGLPYHPRDMRSAGTAGGVLRLCRSTPSWSPCSSRLRRPPSGASESRLRQGCEVEIAICPLRAGPTATSASAPAPPRDRATLLPRSDHPFLNVRFAPSIRWRGMASSPRARTAPSRHSPQRRADQRCHWASTRRAPTPQEVDSDRIALEASTEKLEETLNPRSPTPASRASIAIRQRKEIDKSSIGCSRRGRHPGPPRCHQATISRTAPGRVIMRLRALDPGFSRQRALPALVQSRARRRGDHRPRLVRPRSPTITESVPARHDVTASRSRAPDRRTVLPAVLAQTWPVDSLDDKEAQ